jgi:hypothetical protein
MPSPGGNTVPAAYRGLYSFLQNAIAQANNVLTSIDKGQTNQVTLGSELLSANGNIGPGLLKPHAIDGVRVYLDGLQAVHVGGVTVAVSYPLILSRFPNSAQYLAFFEAVAQEVHSRGMKLDIETGPIFPDQGITVSYRGLTASRYASDKNEIAQTILNQLQRDYLNLGSEPDTEAKLLSLPVLNTPAGWTSYVTQASKGLNRGSTKIAAGIGTWGNVAIAKSLMNTDLDAIAIHFYPINSQAMTIAVAVAELAHQKGKALILDETWLYKSQSFAGSNPYNVYKLDPFNFWAPLDQQYLAAMVRLCKLENIEYVSPFWSEYFFAYLNYSPALANASYNLVREASGTAASQALQDGMSTSTGQFYAALASGK